MPVWSLNFNTREVAEITQDEISDSITRGLFCWIDMQTEDLRDPSNIAETLKLDRAEFSQSNNESATLFSAKRIRFELNDPQLLDGKLIPHQVRAIIGAGFLLTIDFANARFLRGARTTFKDDFKTAARTPGFLLFELADHLYASFRHTLGELSKTIEEMELTMFDEPSAGVFIDASELTRRALELRKSIIDAQENFDELAFRHSPLVAESARPALQKKANDMLRLAGELSHERDTLSSSLQLYLGMVGMQNNRALNRLTAFSIVFLPLGFLAGIFGMNFSTIPGLDWPYSLHAFAGASLLIALCLMIFLRKQQNSR